MRCLRKRCRAVTLSIAAVAAVGPSAAWGQAFPVKPVRYVVPFGAGASPDIIGRLLAERLSRIWGHQVIVDNRVGAAGVLGSAFVAKSAPDGHTLLQCNIGSNAISVSLHAKIPYDQLRDFAPITRIGMTPNMITVHPSVPFRSIKELIAYAKSNPGKLNYSSGLPGVSPQLSMELLKLVAKIDLVNIPYKVGAQGVTDTIAGQVPVNVSNAPVTVGPIHSGRLKPVAVTSAMRAPQFPSVPTVQEGGLPDFDVQSWQGVCAPAGTPAAVLSKIHEDFTAVLRMPDVQQRMSELMMPPAPTSPDAFDKFIRAEIGRWAKVIKDAGIPQQ
jgi:tripartite-type tricarboxylate transporter receptor subunit TctC